MLTAGHADSLKPLGRLSDSPRGAGHDEREIPRLWPCVVSIYPTAEQTQERFTLCWSDGLGRQPAQHADRLAHLLHIGGTALAFGQVRHEYPVHVGIECSLDVVGNQLDELLAADFVKHHAG